MPEPSGKNIVVCSDGTGLSHVGATSNVLRLCELAVNDGGRQVACYDAGVGTGPSAGGTVVGRGVRRAAELWLGLGVMDNVAELYVFLMRHYEPGDSIFLFGFSRGAFTVRALAGLIHVCGLLPRNDQHLLSEAVGLYRTSEARIASTRRSKGLQPRVVSTPGADHATFDEEARLFKSRASRSCHVQFMGLWDTVKAYGWFWPQSFPVLRHNPSVRIVRHAVSLHERRSAFQVTGWGDRKPDVKEVWFRGDHSDVGGGYVARSALSDATLGGMLGEATAAGLRIDQTHQHVLDALATRAASARACTPSNQRAGLFWAAECVPRFELDNGEYPPHRWPRFWPTGVRRPMRHREGEALWLHETVTTEDTARMPSPFVWEATQPPLMT